MAAVNAPHLVALVRADAVFKNGKLTERPDESEGGDQQVASHGRSMEAEVRAILTDAVAEPGQSPDLFHTLMDRFGELGGVELDLPPRATRPRAAEFAL